MRPSRITAMRSQVSSISPRIWLISTTLPPPATRSAGRNPATRPPGRPAKRWARRGITSSGALIHPTARAISTICRLPIGSSATMSSAAIPWPGKSHQGWCRSAPWPVGANPSHESLATSAAGSRQRSGSGTRQFLKHATNAVLAGHLHRCNCCALHARQVQHAAISTQGTGQHLHQGGFTGAVVTDRNRIHPGENSD